MTKEQVQELLKPRYRVVADYPGSKGDIGDILYQYEFETSVTGMYTFVSNLEIPLQGYNIAPSVIDKYPHLFQKLEWWQERTIEGMPEYLKQTGMVDGAGNPIPDWYLKVKKHFSAGNGEWRDDSIHIFCTEDCLPGWPLAVRSMNYNGFEPATSEEYHDYIKSSTGTKIK
jgi:hypothetical protein